MGAGMWRKELKDTELEGELKELKDTEVDIQSGSAAIGRALRGE